MLRLPSLARLLALTTGLTLIAACASFEPGDFSDGETIMAPGTDPNAPGEPPGLLLRMLRGEDLSAPARTAGAPFNKIGVIVDGPSREFERAFDSALSTSAAKHPVAIVGEDALVPHLRGDGCAASKPTPCLDALAVYPGVRLVALAKLAPTADGKQLAGQITLLDTLLDTEYPAAEVRLPARDGQPTDAALRTLADSILRQATDKAQTAPWTARAFSRDGDRWHINAGRRSGLKVGDELEVRAGGKVIRAPSGAPAAWTPGPVKGRLRIDQLAGDDVAIATLVDGQPPQPADPLLLAGEQ